MSSHIHFQTIGATDLIRARDLYRDKLGFVVQRDEPYGEDRWIFMALPGAQTRLHFDKRSSIPTQSVPELILSTETVDEDCAAQHARGVPIQQGPDDAPWSPGTRWAMIHDSEGNLILLQNVKD